MTQENYMKFALDLAKKGCGFTAPNPMVGAVIVKKGRIIGQGYHEKYGGLHAERNALASCDESPRGAVLYVTLEPCCHWGKTPPCTDAILESGITKVVIGSEDPNPLVSGKGAELLKQNGIEVLQGVLKAECDKLNEVFFHYIQTGMPYVIMKYAMTADGKLATHTGRSKWITGEGARHKVHQDRSRYAAVMVGIGTVLTDDPLLTCRVPEGRNPVRIVCDSYLRTPLDSQIVRTARVVPTILATCCSDTKQAKPYDSAGCRVLSVPQQNGHVNLKELMKKLGKLHIDSILLEGGGELNFSALQSGIVNRVQAYIAPKLFGGSTAKSPVGGPGVDSPDEAYRLKRPVCSTIDGDILLEWEVEGIVHGDY